MATKKKTTKKAAAKKSAPKKKPTTTEDNATELNEGVQDEFCKYLRMGSYQEQAAAMIGVSSRTVQRWLARGRKEISRREKHADLITAEANKVLRPVADKKRKARDDEHRQKAREEQPFVEFFLAVEKAMATSELGDLGVIAKSAQGKHVVETRTVTTKDDNGNDVVEKIEKHAKPEWTAAAWRLERRNPKRWARRQHVELSGDEDGAPIAVSLVDAFKRAHVESKAKKGKG